MLNSCPWQNFTPDNLYFCEAELCGWIRQPANTWSSLVIIFVGIVIIYLTKIKKQKYLELFGWMVTFLGVGTFFYHATTALWGGILDIGGMFFVIFFLLATNCWRLWKLDRKIILPIFWFGVVFFTTLHALKPNLGTPFFAIVTMFTLVTEMVIWIKDGRKQASRYVFTFILLVCSAILALFSSAFNIVDPKIGIPVFGFTAISAYLLVVSLWIKEGKEMAGKYFLFAMALFILALGVWVFDSTKVVCDPNNHLIQGHAIWHILSGTAFYFVYSYLSRIKLPEWELI